MNKRRIFAIVGLVFALMGVLLMVASIFWQTTDHALLQTGLACTFIAFIFTFILNRKSPQPEKHTDKQPSQE